jgi:hypothetical protein
VRLELHPFADAEAMEAAHRYEDQQPGLGLDILVRLEDAYIKIVRTPRRFAKLETVPLEGEIRRALLPRFPYLIIYEICDDLIHVLAVAHASRRPDYWIERRT